MGSYGAYEQTEQAAASNSTTNTPVGVSLSLSQHRKLAQEVAEMRNEELLIAEQVRDRTEMAYIQANNDLRRAQWWSLSVYALCVLAACATLSFTLQPTVVLRWGSIVIALVAVAACLIIIGRRRDGKYTKDSWTRLRFGAPLTTK